MTLNSDRIAVFVAGNSAIYFPALVALRSIRRLNRHLPLDFFVSFEEADLSAEHAKMFDDYQITFVPSRELASIESLDSFDLMHEGRWPKHVFYNWVMPMYLRSLGYNHAVKVDYDILCMSPYMLEDICDSSSVFSACVFSQDLLREGITASVCEAFGADFNRQDEARYFNAGFAAINIVEYTERDFFSRFQAAYSLLMTDCPSIPNAEQVAWSLVCASDPQVLRNIDHSYNVRTTTLPVLNRDGSARIRNLHFVTHNKPWLPADFTYLDRYVPRGRTSVYIYREAWLREASCIPGFSKFVSSGVPGVLDTVGLLSRVLGAHYVYERGR
ncbi:Lipopolysaccharide biosynthesis protein, LPS:glycosyltransferase [Brevibacterium aurantiacum]|uniref:Lipopolysaccharide biosynthesis protein, LPS:glycosyltransferase n=1 Tax=Brevibacterium aurantiacum TaxID=273384 RepID=A0A2H1KYK1_BREAU|nr:glycosyltransferase [Brevibacterium aurantiacum]SMY04853.1 Lipopolysaccharide biosynthesis protein, LPS:glycosyltransferase [Brevibacterium aurantiacum]